MIWCQTFKPWKQKNVSNKIKCRSLYLWILRWMLFEIRQIVLSTNKKKSMAIHLCIDHLFRFVIDSGAVNHLLIHIYILIVVAGKFSCFFVYVSSSLDFPSWSLSFSFSLLHSMLCSFILIVLVCTLQRAWRQQKNIQFRVDSHVSAHCFQFIIQRVKEVSNGSTAQVSPFNSDGLLINSPSRRGFFS